MRLQSIQSVMIKPFLLQINTVADTLATQGEAGAESVVRTKSILEFIIAGGVTMIPLALISILTIYIIAERIKSINKAAKEQPDFMNKINDYIHDGKIESALSLCSSQDSPIARMIGKGVSKIGRPVKDISASIENVAKLEVTSLEKNLPLLATCAGAAPMIGFLGTVVGMIQTFQSMVENGKGVEVTDLASGIMVAMVTTVGGLIIGIVAYIAYNMLTVKVDKVINRMEATSIEFLELLDEPGN